MLDPAMSLIRTEVFCRVLASAALMLAATTPGLPAAERYPSPPEGVVILTDLAYLAPGRAEKLDLYLPENRKPGKMSPAVVMIHGGGWAGGDKAALREYETGAILARAGYVAASINYQMAPGKRWPTNVHDCKNAVRFLRANAGKYGVDAKHIGVMGGSAGGHLALMVAYTSGVPGLEPTSPYPGVSSRVSCVIDLYGITNLLTRQKTDPRGKPTGERSNTTALFPQTRQQDPGRWRLASPVSYVAKTSPPTLILHGLADATVDYLQAKELAAKLEQHGVEHKLILLEGVGHTFYLKTWRGKPLPVDLEPVVLGFLNRHLR